MKGDFSRVSFDPRNHFSQVLLQQGRVTLDADPNEQSAILLHYLRTLARDIFGPYAAPVDHAGFGLAIDDAQGMPTLHIGAGRCYVQGMLVETDGCDYLHQPHYTPAADGKEGGSGDPLRHWLESSSRDDQWFWVYLKVWERHLTSVELPRLREVALGGPDTCSRVQVVWQVRGLAVGEIEQTLSERWQALQKKADDTQDPELQAQAQALQDQLALLKQDYTQACAVPLSLFEREPPRLAARLQPSDRLDDPCITHPDAAYRGVENHLYRVEIHRGSEDGVGATFKWSRDNGSVVTRWLGGGGSRLEVANARDFRDAKWVELSDDEDDLLGRPGQLCRIASVEGNALVLTAEQDRLPNPTSKVRRWDQVTRGDVQLVDGVVPVVVTADAESGWIELEDGIQVRFASEGDYRSGDYWLIPARTTGDIEWPVDDADDALYQPPRGVDYHYAPLGFVGLSDGAPRVENSCQCLVYPPSTCGLLGRAQLNDDGSRPNHLAVATVAKPAVAKPATGKASVGKKAVSKATPKRTTPKP